MFHFRQQTIVVQSVFDRFRIVYLEVLKLIILMNLSKKRSSSLLEWPGQLIKMQVVFEKEGDNYPISVKIMVHQNSEKQVSLSQIIWRLKQQNLNDYSNSSVSYFHEGRKIYVFGFMLPPDLREQELAVQQKYRKRIQESAFSLSSQNQLAIKLRFRRKVGSRLEVLKDQQRTKYSEAENGQGRQVKQKEKTVQEVVEKVALWRKLYTGFLNEEGEVVHMDLETSATQIGIVKKTLDDYLLQIRNGKRYGFNFHKRRGEKIGELRSFVKEHKQEDDKSRRKS